MRGGEGSDRGHKWGRRRREEERMRGKGEDMKEDRREGRRGEKKEEQICVGAGGAKRKTEN